MDRLLIVEGPRWLTPVPTYCIAPTFYLGSFLCEHSCPFFTRSYHSFPSFLCNYRAYANRSGSWVALRQLSLWTGTNVVWTASIIILVVTSRIWFPALTTALLKSGTTRSFWIHIFFLSYVIYLYIFWYIFEIFSEPIPKKSIIFVHTKISLSLEQAFKIPSLIFQARSKFSLGWYQTKLSCDIASFGEISAGSH